MHVPLDLGQQGSDFFHPMPSSQCVDDVVDVQMLPSLRHAKMESSHQAASINVLMRPRSLRMSISQVQPPMLAECSILASQGVVAPHTDRFNCPNSTPSRMEAILGVLDLAYRPEQSERRPRSGRRRGNNDFGWGSAAGLAETCPSPRVSEARKCRRPTLRPRLDAAGPNS